MDMNSTGDLHDNDTNPDPLQTRSNYHDIKSLCDTVKASQNHNGFNVSALHLNIQSLPAKLDGLKQLIANFQEEHVFIDFILLCETFLNDRNSDFCNIPGYKLIHNNRTKKTRGGVAMYIKSNIQYKLRNDLAIFEEGVFESIFVETSDNMIVGEIYRIPNTNVKKSIEHYDSILRKLRDKPGWHHAVLPRPGTGLVRTSRCRCRCTGAARG